MAKKIERLKPVKAVIINPIELASPFASSFYNVDVGSVSEMRDKINELIDAFNALEEKE